MMKFSETLYIIIPAYNEEENIKTVIDEWYPVIDSKDDRSRIVVVNDGSTDRTQEIVAEIAGVRPKVRLLSKKNGGHGSALLYGYQYAIKNSAVWIFQTDADGQTCSLEFDGFWNLRNYYDAILGMRLRRGDGKFRKFAEDVLRFALRLIFGVKIPDANAPFRLMKTKLVEKYIPLLPVGYNLPNVMLTTYFSYFHEPVLFRNITFRKRKRGTNSIQSRKLIAIGTRAIFDFLHFRKNLGHRYENMRDRASK